jgi:hypothetical protein
MDRRTIANSLHVQLIDLDYARENFVVMNL